MRHFRSTLANSIALASFVLPWAAQGALPEGCEEGFGSLAKRVMGFGKPTEVSAQPDLARIRRVRGDVAFKHVKLKDGGLDGLPQMDFSRFIPVPEDPAIRSRITRNTLPQSQGSVLKTFIAERKPYLLKSTLILDAIRPEAVMHELLRSQGVPTPFVGVTRTPNGMTAIVMKYVEGSAFRCTRFRCNPLDPLPRSDVPLDAGVSQRIREIGQKLDDAGIKTEAIQFMVDRSGQVWLMDVGGYELAPQAPVGQIARDFGMIGSEFDKMTSRLSQGRAGPHEP